MHEAGESNWWSEVSAKLQRYKLGCDLDEIKSLSKGVFARRVRKAIIETAFSELQETCASMKKTADVDYQAFGTQDYLLKLYPPHAKAIFKWRSKTLDIKTHSTYKYEDTLCRGCGSAEESVEHVMNCDENVHVMAEEITKLGEIDSETCNNLQLQAKRITSFIARFVESSGYEDSC